MSAAPIIEIADHPGYRLGHRVENPTPAEKLACQRARRTLRGILDDLRVERLEARVKTLRPAPTLALPIHGEGGPHRGGRGS